MEFGIELQSRFLCHGRQEKYVGKGLTESAKPAWTSKYGYVAVDGLNLGVCVDGMNEKGLSFGLLWFPGAQYPQPNTDSTAINVVDVGNWILGNFSTVDEVKVALSEKTIWADYIPELKQIPPAHFAVHDAKGNSIVVEFIDGKQVIYDNPNGVMTNAPEFTWHLTNLRNYIQLSASNPQSIKIGGTILAPPGQGEGFLGIPGDWTPPSRFVRTSAMLQFAKPTANSYKAANLAGHMLNAVDIPRGVVRDPSGSLENSDYTQWALVKDLTKKVIYYRTYDYPQMRTIGLDLIDFNKSKTEPIPMTMDNEKMTEMSSFFRTKTE